MIGNILNKWYWMWRIPLLEKQLEQIDQDIKFLTSTLKEGDAATMYTLRDLRVAKSFITHQIDYNSGWIV